MGRYSNRVEVMGRYLNHSAQGECLRNLLEMVPSGSKTAKTRTPRRVCRRLETSRVEELIKVYVEGVSVDVLAGKFGVDQSTVQKHARRHDLPRRSPRLGPSQIKEAVTLYTEGQSLLKLAAHFGHRHGCPCAAKGWGHASTTARLDPVGTTRSLFWGRPMSSWVGCGSAGAWDSARYRMGPQFLEVVTRADVSARCAHPRSRPAIPRFRVAPASAPNRTPESCPP